MAGWTAFLPLCSYRAESQSRAGARSSGCGAQTEDGESLYHSSEHADPACVRLLLEYGASPRGKNALKHMLDCEDAEGLRLLLAAGADPNELNPQGDTALHWAVGRGRSVEIVANLLDAGAAVDARRRDGRTAYALAVRSGQTEAAKLLESGGADTKIETVDRPIGELTAADPEDLARMVAESRDVPLPAEYHRLLPEFAAGGVPVDVRGDNGGNGSALGLLEK